MLENWKNNNTGNKNDFIRDVENTLSEIFRDHRYGDYDAFGDRSLPEKAEERYMDVKHTIEKMGFLSDIEKKDLLWKVDKHILSITYVEEDVKEPQEDVYNTSSLKELTRQKIIKKVELDPKTAIEKRIEILANCPNDWFLGKYDGEDICNLCNIIKDINGITQEEKHFLFKKIVGLFEKKLDKLEEYYESEKYSIDSEPVTFYFAISNLVGIMQKEKDYLSRKMIGMFEKKIAAVEKYYMKNCKDLDVLFLSSSIYRNYSVMSIFIKNTGVILPEEKANLLDRITESYDRIKKFENENAKWRDAQRTAIRNREVAFNAAKERYNSQSSFKKLICIIKGQSPDQLPRDYSEEELNKLYR